MSNPDERCVVFQCYGGIPRCLEGIFIIYPFSNSTYLHRHAALQEVLFSCTCSELSVTEGCVSVKVQSRG